MLYRVQTIDSITGLQVAMSPNTYTITEAIELANAGNALNQLNGYGFMCYTFPVFN